MLAVLVDVFWETFGHVSGVRGCGGEDVALYTAATTGDKSRDAGRGLLHVDAQHHHG